MILASLDLHIEQDKSGATGKKILLLVNLNFTAERSPNLRWSMGCHGILIGCFIAPGLKVIYWPRDENFGHIQLDYFWWDLGDRQLILPCH